MPYANNYLVDHRKLKLRMLNKKMPFILKVMDLYEIIVSQSSK